MAPPRATSRSIVPQARPAHAPSPLPARFDAWFRSRGWRPRDHQLALIEKAEAGRSVLLVAPTGAGKTLAGFLPSLIELAAAKPPAFGQSRRLHTLYISPLKALAVDIARNLDAPVSEMALAVKVEARTGDTPPHRRQRQVERPPDILLTTPEQLALLLAHRESTALFGDLKRVIVDELHSVVTSKRGDLLALDLARLYRLSPGLTAVGLSATVREPQALCRYLDARAGIADLVVTEGGARPHIGILETAAALPIAGHTTAHAMHEVYAAIRAHKTTLVFVNTRMQAEFAFHELWKLNDDNLAIALHHGSLDVAQRRKVEAAMAEGRLRAVVCTSTLDLGIDWGDVDLVINLGAPKGASRMMQRIGRANHRLDEPSKAYLVPSNRFEMLECRAALDAIAEAAQDTPEPRVGALDVLAQHVLGAACAEAFDVDELFEEVRGAAPYAGLTRAEFDAAMNFVATGGYALRTYDRFAKIRQGPDGRWRVTNRRIAQQYRMNVGTIVESVMVKVRLGRARGKSRGGGGVIMGGRVLGEIEELFAETMSIGDTFAFAGEVLRFEGMVGNEALVTRTASPDPMVPSYDGGKFPLSTFLAERVRAMIADPNEWRRLPTEVAGWLSLQRLKSVIPGRGEMLVETFERSGRFYLVAYPFEGRLAHRTLGMLLTRRLERAKLKPLGFVANDYGLATYGLEDLGREISSGRLRLGELFGEDMLGDDLEAWLDDSALMKRTFRTCAIIAGLIERRHPGAEKTRRQITMSTDLVYDVLRRHEPDHVLLQAARADAATGLLDLRRVAQMLSRIKGRIVHKALDRVSPLSISVILEIGREAVFGEAADAILAEAEAQLMQEVMA
jgi:ATP-dependent Lhr-like helicase